MILIIKVGSAILTPRLYSPSSCNHDKHTLAAVLTLRLPFSLFAYRPHSPPLFTVLTPHLYSPSSFNHDKEHTSSAALTLRPYSPSSLDHHSPSPSTTFAIVAAPAWASHGSGAHNNSASTVRWIASSHHGTARPVNKHKRETTTNKISVCVFIKKMKKWFWRRYLFFRFYWK